MTNEILKQCKSEYEKLQDQINDLHLQMQTKAKVLMHEAFKDFFTKYNSVVDSIYWTQFQPFFNDGEHCVFRVNDVFIRLKDDEDACDYEGSTLFGQSDIQSLEKKLSDLIEWEKDPITAAKRYQADCLQKFKKDPFAPRKIYNYDRSKYVEKSTEDLMKEWNPSHVSKEDLVAELEQARKFVEQYPNLQTDFENLSNVISSIDDDLMLNMFGNHVKVIVSASGIETEAAYDHD